MKGDIYIDNNHFDDNYIAIDHYFYDNFVPIYNYFHDPPFS